MSARVPGLRVYKAQPPRERSPGDYGLAEMPGAPAHLEAVLPGWRFSHAVIYAGDGHLVEARFDRVRERDAAGYPVRDISWFGVRRAPDGSCVMQSLALPGSLNDAVSAGVASLHALSRAGLRSTSRACRCGMDTVRPLRL